MDFYSALNNFESLLEPQLVNFVDLILPNVSLFAAVIVAVYVAYKVIKSFLGEGERLDAATLVRPCLILASLVLYNSLVDLLIDTPVNIVNEIIAEGATSVTGATPGDLKGMRDKMTYFQSTGGPDGGGIMDIVQVHPFFEFIHMLLYFCASVAGGYILFRQLVVKSIYLLIGPFALAFSLIVGNEKVVNSWFQGYLSVLLWLPILSIVQTIILLMPVETTNFNGEDMIFSIAIQVVMIFVVFQVPKYANILVAQGSEMGSQYGQGIKSEMQSIRNNRAMSKSMRGEK